MRQNFNTVDSHSSALNNQEMAMLSAEIDNLALSSGTTLKFQQVRAFYTAVKQYYRKAFPIIEEKDVEVIEKYRQEAEQLQEKIFEDPQYRTKKACMRFYNYVEQIHLNVRIALQKQDFYFRTAKKQKKGLDEISFIGIQNEQDNTKSSNV
ncbi:MAG: hypothetical protein ACOC80_00645 [Petrotogales bacterium]